MACDLGFTPTDNENYYFLSYNKEDADRVSEIAQQMSRVGIELWYDKAIEYGEKWERTIVEKIHGCQAVVLFFTRGILHKVDSYVEKEYKMALAFKRKIYIILMDEIEDEDVPPTKVPWWIDIKALQCVEAHAYADSYRIGEEITAALAATKEHGTGDAQKNKGVRSGASGYGNDVQQYGRRVPSEGRIRKGLGLLRKSASSV